MTEASLLATRLAPPLQTRTRLTPPLHITRAQLQPLLRAQPRRQARDQPRRAHHHQARLRAATTAGTALVIPMAAEDVLQVVVRPRQVRRLIATEQARGVTLAHLQEVPQA